MNNNEKTKKNYVAPMIGRVDIEMEQGIAAGSTVTTADPTVNDPTNSGSSDGEVIF